MKTILLLLLCLSFLFSFSQNNNLPNTGKKTPHSKAFHTEVFTLSTCEADEIAIRKEGDPLDVKYLPVRRLSMNANNFSAFKITGINPLRYKYFINNQFISKFFDANDISSGDLTKDTTNLTIDTIQVLQLFNADITPKKDSDNIQECKRRIKLIKDSIQALKEKIFALTEKIDFNKTQKKIDIDYPKDSLIAYQGKKKYDDLVDSLNKQKAELDFEYQKQSLKLNDELDILGSLIASTINSNAEDILNNFRKLDGFVKPAASDSMNFIKRVSGIVADVADSLNRHLKQIDSLLNKLPHFLGRINDNNNGAVLQSYKLKYDNNSKPLSKDDKVKSLILLIGRVKEFAPDKTFTIDENVFFNNDYLGIKKTIFDIEEFAATEKIKLEESFVIFTSLEIGKLLQNETINCSRFQNQIRDQSCLDSSKVLEIGKVIHFDSTLFRYIQDVSSNLNVLIKYLELNNPKFNSTVGNINSNYRSLLKFVTVLDYTYKRNTVLFTLPVHNDYRNADLVRYTVEKRDKFTGNYEPYVYDIWLKGGLKIDFSIAIMMSRITDFTYNKLALYKTILDTAGNQVTAPSDSMFYLQKADLGDYAFAFGGMVNIMFRTGGWWVTPGISAGIAYSTSQNLQFLLGGSLQFGKSERLIAHFGIASGLARRLDLSQYTILSSKDKDKDIYTVMGNQASASVSYINRYIFKPFFGISYNLSKKNALNAIGTGADNFNGAFPKQVQ